MPYESARLRLECVGLVATLGLEPHGPRMGLDMLLNNQLVSARAAKELGLVDHAFGPRPSKTELWWFIEELKGQAGTAARRRGRPRLREHRWLFRHTILPEFERGDAQ